MEKDLFLKEIVTELKQLEAAREELYGWKAKITKKRSTQRLLYSTAENALFPETMRDNITETAYSVTVMTKDDGNMGTMGITIDKMAPLRVQLENAITSALFIKNRPWNLVEPDGKEFKKVLQVDARIKEDPIAVAEELIEKASAVCRSLKGININYAELFLNYSESLSVTSTGFSLPKESTDIYFEMAMEKLPLPNTQEIHNNKSAISIEDLNIEEFIRDAARETSYLGKVEMPDTTDNAVILVSKGVINQIFHCLLEQLDASREFMRRPCLKEGEAVHAAESSDAGDRIQLSLDPYIDLMAESTSFTEEALAAKAGVVIEGNRIMQRYISNRMAQYLNYEINPLCGNIILECGSRSYEELIKAAPKVIEILTFSSLLLNSDYLTYSSEIKLAREFDNTTGKVRFLKGGVVSGNIRENLNNPLFSSSKATHNIIGSLFDSSQGYMGPEYMLIRSGVAISGK